MTGVHLGYALGAILFTITVWLLGIDHERSRVGGTKQLQLERDTLTGDLRYALTRLDETTADLAFRDLTDALNVDFPGPDAHVIAFGRLTVVSTASLPPTSEEGAHL